MIGNERLQGIEYKSVSKNIREAKMYLYHKSN